MMATFMHTLLTSLDQSWREVDLLLEGADKERLRRDEEMHDVLCRAAIVLTSAHLEGFVRDCARAFVDDINRSGSFRQCASAIKRTFCGIFILSQGEESNTKVAKLIQMLDGLDTKLTLEPFLFDGKYDDQKNPSPTAISKVCGNFGIRKPFSLLAGSRLDVVFTGSPTDTRQLNSDLRSHLEATVATFPYSVDLSQFGLHQAGAVTSGQRTLWEMFLDDLMEKRHKIAHGSSYTNSTTVEELREIRQKTVVLQYAVMLLLSGAAR